MVHLAWPVQNIFGKDIFCKDITRRDNFAKKVEFSDVAPCTNLCKIFFSVEILFTWMRCTIATNLVKEGFYCTCVSWSSFNAPATCILSLLDWSSAWSAKNLDHILASATRISQQLISDGIIEHFGTIMNEDGADGNEDGQDNYNDGGQESWLKIMRMIIAIADHWSSLQCPPEI